MHHRVARAAANQGAQDGRVVYEPKDITAAELIRVKRQHPQHRNAFDALNMVLCKRL